MNFEWFSLFLSKREFNLICLTETMVSGKDVGVTFFSNIKKMEVKEVEFLIRFENH